VYEKNLKEHQTELKNYFLAAFRLDL